MKTYDQTTILVAAAGMATRMKSVDTPKALVKFKGRALIDWATCAFTPYIRKMQIVIRRETSPDFSSYFENNESQGVHFAYQNEPLGTAYAIRDGLSSIDTEWVLAVWGDHVGASRAKIHEIFATMESTKADFYLPLVSKKNPYVYFEINEEGNLQRFYETNLGASRINEGFSDCGFFLFKKEIVSEFLELYLSHERKESTFEVNFLSLFSEMQKSGIKFHLIFLEDELLTLGINTQAEVRTLEEDFELEETNGQ